MLTGKVLLSVVCNLKEYWAEFVLSKVVDSNRCLFLMRRSVVSIRMCFDETNSSR
jgi:hypothetical protein